ncbi:MAG: phosphoglucosamine mutase, partial [Candidatus Zixiibacteriota bacterium]
QYLAESEKPMSQLFSELPGYFMVKRKAELTKNFEKNLVKLKKSFARGRINPLDGIRIDFEDSWLHIRKSNTEPLVRVIAEAQSEKKASELVADGLRILGRD